MKSKLVIFAVLMATVLSMTVSSATFFPRVQAVDTTIRIVAVGDIDCNSGQTKQFDIMKTYNADLYFSGGDYGYSNGQCVLNNIKNHGWSSVNHNVAIACGNHDNCGELRNFLGNTKNYGKMSFMDGKIDVFIIDANTQFGSGSSQFNTIKSDLESSHAMYKIAIVHQPFATAKSTHPPNGQFTNYHELFKANHVDVVLQAHNHNNQRFVINNITYTVNGGGHHDTGSSLYPISSDQFQGNQLLFKDASNNGFLVMDLNLNTKNIKGQFITDSKQVKDTWEVSGGNAPPPPPTCKPDEHLENGVCVKNPPPPPPPMNLPPILVVDSPIKCVATFDCTLTLLEVSDLDGNITSIKWEQESGPKIDFTNSVDNFTATINPTNNGTYVFSVTATDNDNAMTKRMITANVGTLPPPPECGPNEHLHDGMCMPNENMTNNNTFTVAVGKGEATFIPENQTQNANVTLFIERGTLVLPEP